MNGNKKVKSSTVWKILILAGVILVAIIIFVLPIAYFEDSYTGEFIVANKVYMPDGNIRIVVYFNETPDTHYLIFEDWDAKHSVQLSNMERGERVKILYRDFVFGVRTIVEIDVL